MAVNGTRRVVKFAVLDIGLSTGVAVFEAVRDSSSSPPTLEVDHVASVTYYRTKLRQGLTMVRDLHTPELVLMEPPVIMRGHLGNQLQEVIAICLDVFRTVQIVKVDPAQWKSTPFRKHPTPGLKTPHERDAYRLGMWYAAHRL